MSPLVTLMIALLTVAIFFENYARTRSHRVADKSSEAATLLAAEWRRRIVDGGLTANEVDLHQAFEVPRSVRRAPLASWVLAGLNLGIFIAFVYSLKSHEFKLSPVEWDPEFTVALVLVVGHLFLAAMASEGASEVVIELQSSKRRFGDELIAALRSELIGPPVGFATPESIAPKSLTSDSGAGSGALIDDLFLSGDGASSSAFVVKLIATLINDDILSTRSRREAASLSALCELDKAIGNESDRRYAQIWARGVALLLGPDDPARIPLKLNRRGVPNRNEGHTPTGHLAVARHAELVLKSSAARLSYPVDQSDVDIHRPELEKLASRQLNAAAHSVTRHMTSPPARTYPQRRSSWISGASEANSARAENYGRLLVRAAAASTDASERRRWLSITAAVCGAHSDGDGLIAALSEQLAWESLAADDELILSLGADCRAAYVGDRHPIDPTMRVVLAQALALHKRGLKKRAIGVLLDAAPSWAEDPFTLGLLVHMCLMRFKFPSFTDVARIIRAAFQPSTFVSQESAERATMTGVINWLERIVDIAESTSSSSSLFHSATAQERYITGLIASNCLTAVFYTQDMESKEPPAGLDHEALDNFIKVTSGRILPDLEGRLREVRSTYRV